MIKTKKRERNHLDPASLRIVRSNNAIIGVKIANLRVRVPVTQATIVPRVRDVQEAVLEITF